MHARATSDLIIAVQNGYQRGAYRNAAVACCGDLPAVVLPSHSVMFVISEADAASIRAVFHKHGEFAAAVELRRLFPGLRDTKQARECARTIAGWQPLPRRLRPVRLRPSKAG